MQFEVVSSVNDCRNKDTIYLFWTIGMIGLHIRHCLR